MKLPGMRVLYADRSLTVAAQRTTLLLDRGGDMRFDARVPLSCGRFDHACVGSELLRRLSRREVGHCLKVCGKLVVFGFDRVQVVDPVDAKLLGVHRPPIDTRPLHVCSVNGGLFVGEYHTACGGAARLWGSRDLGASWEVVRVFEEVRHVHGVFYDRYEKAFWVTVGDTDDESGIWKLSHDFRAADCVLGGSQEARAVTLLFRERHVYFGTDSPILRNRIGRIERCTGRIEWMQETGGSVFWGCEVGGMMFFSTAVEPSPVNRSRRVEIWRSADGVLWTLWASFVKDPLPMKLFRYGQVRFPYGMEESDRVWLVTEGVRGGMSSYVVDPVRRFPEEDNR